jgi:hypothetical protein
MPGFGNQRRGYALTVRERKELLALAVTYVTGRPITKLSSERHQKPVTEEHR